MGERKAPKSGQKDMLSQHWADTMPETPSAIIEGQLDVRLQEHIGRKLRAVYDEIVEEPIPDRFLKLLAELRRKEEGQT